MNIHVYTKQMQGQVNFGKLSAHKPLNFPGQKAPVNRIGSLFYWSWSTTDTEFSFDMHPHEGFHILSYILSGTVHHIDSAGNSGELRSGDAQVIHAGSGIQHAETIVGPNAQAFQIWFEPYLNQAVMESPFYASYKAEHFAVEGDDTVMIKQVAGNNGGVPLGVDANVMDITIEKDHQISLNGQSGRSLAIMTISGTGQIKDETVHANDFITIEAMKDEEIIAIQATEKLRIFMIDMPTDVGYPLYQK